MAALLKICGISYLCSCRYPASVDLKKCHEAKAYRCIAVGSGCSLSFRQIWRRQHLPFPSFAHLFSHDRSRFISTAFAVDFWCLRSKMDADKDRPSRRSVRKEQNATDVRSYYLTYTYAFELNACPHCVQYQISASLYLEYMRC